MTYSRLTEDICRSLDVLPDAPEEGRGIASVTNSMIICQGKRDNWPHDDSAGDNPGSVHDTADPEDRDFWEVNDGRGAVHVESAVIVQGECPTRPLRGTEHTVSSPVDNFRHPRAKVGSFEELGVPDDRHNEAATGCDRDPEMDAVIQDYAVVVGIVSAIEQGVLRDPNTQMRASNPSNVIAA